MKGMAENPDVFFAHRESCNRFYDAVPDIVSDYMKEISKITGREYRPFNYYGAPDAENIIMLARLSAKSSTTRLPRVTRNSVSSTYTSIVRSASSICRRRCRRA